MAARTLRQLVGELLIVGVEGTQLTPVERAWIKLLQPGGVILFRRNIEDVSQTRDLLASVSELSSASAIRCVDVEGGLVDRLRDVIAPMPSASAVAATGSKVMAERHGELIGREVRALGFNTTLAPVLDLALPASAAVMQTRTTSPDPAEVATYAAAFLKGLRKSGAIGCGKHFPGLGGGTLDSHQATPSILRSWDELWSEDMLPYRELASALPMVMVSHASYPATKGAPVPASVSKYWITDILRKKIGYRGLILSDDMEMGGILSHASIEEAAVSAVLAGTDRIEICHSPALILRAFESLLTEAERSAAFRRRISNTASRLARWKRKFVAKVAPQLNVARMERLRQETKRFTAEVEEAGARRQG
ncbi:MAG TPA: beta-N-acetylhexosaminidase [Acidisarcina sp.]|nr:beta-N-acetylhexosaminidase [Acidisarcina sp.]